MAARVTNGSTITARDVVDLVLLGPVGDRRQLQDSPVLGDVWSAFADQPRKRHDVLVTPHREHSAGKVAATIAIGLSELPPSRLQIDDPDSDKNDPCVAYLQGLVVARLTFRELLVVVVPGTEWWRKQKMRAQLSEPAAEGRLRNGVQHVVSWAGATHDDGIELALKLGSLSSLERYVALAGLILWLSERASAEVTFSDLPGFAVEEVVETSRGILFAIPDGPVAADEIAPIWQVSLNRKVLPALQKSVPAVKADAARTLFKVKCDEIRWAVLDSGVDATHEAFVDPVPAAQGKPAKSRILATYDFRNIRNIVNLDNRRTNTPRFRTRVAGLITETDLTEGQAADYLKQLGEDAAVARPIDWGVVEKFIKRDHPPRPNGPHGTHVAGIIGAGQTSDPDSPLGMCPDIKLYDFRVLSRSIEDTEFAIIAALQFIRYLNDRSGHLVVHGANLSLSIPHDVRNFACGRTPICDECERLINGGVVVVAAAGNLGYQNFETAEGAFGNYAAFSITDPGNGDGVITVGATHRFWPHTYGISFFSSRGPTGDGRLKPDLVAPGERIQSCIPGGWAEMDGTSMAAPHVSGAAAMLMGRYSELIGQPRRIKQILCDSATDLGRERSFQGHGMLDVLRAFQQI